MSIIEAGQTRITGRELPFAVRLKRTRGQALDNLAILEEEAVREQLYGLIKPAELRAMSDAQKAAANAVWIRRLMPHVNEILLMTNKKIEFSETFFEESAINCKVIGEEDERHLALCFGESEIPVGGEAAIFKEIWQANLANDRRNIRTLAKLTPLQVINKAYKAVYRIYPRNLLLA